MVNIYRVSYLSGVSHGWQNPGRLAGKTEAHPISISFILQSYENADV